MLKNVFYALMISSLLSFSDATCLDQKVVYQQNDTLLWSAKYRLVWDDFQGNIPITIASSVKAQTQSGLYVEQIPVKGKVPKYKIQTYFIKSSSWSRVDSDKVLRHEQLHFDISELYARKLRKSFDSLNRKKVTDRNVYKEFYNSNFIRLNRYQDLYDEEVYSGEVSQEEWIENVDFELESLQRYELK